ncbi:MAG: alpha-ketoacid dehydrogenase subunit beta, partial [Brevibacterium sp.]|nr:alpha-ketoacid dehydrogenase subunit beta [Brevibacterium sp.]
MTVTAMTTADEVPAPVSVTMTKALNQALHDSLAADENVLVYGEDVGRLGG